VHFESTLQKDDVFLHERRNLRTGGGIRGSGVDRIFTAGCAANGILETRRLAWPFIILFDRSSQILIDH
jgi:hypothetical protein